MIQYAIKFRGVATLYCCEDLSFSSNVYKLYYLFCDAFKVQKARELKDELIQQRQQHLDRKQRRAEQQRLSVLQEKIRKAQEEEAKVSQMNCGELGIIPAIFCAQKITCLECVAGNTF